MYSPKDISDMPESEVPWDFLVDAPERRRTDRRHDHQSPCKNVVEVERKLAQLANEFYSYRSDCQHDRSEAQKEREEILEKLDKINSHLDRQKGFFAGVVWLGAALVGAASAAFGYFKS